MPFAGKEVGVTRFAECFGNGDFFQRQVILIWRRLHFLRAVSANVIGDAGPHRIFAGYDAGARGRANAARGICLSEAHTAAGERIEIGRLIKLAPVAPQIRPTQIVGENEDNVRTVRCRRGCRRDGCKQSE